MKTNFASTRKAWPLFTVLLTLAVYFLVVRQWLGVATAALIELIVLGGLALVLVGVTLFLLFTLLATVFTIM